jgi:carboxylesterase type B
LVPFAGLESYHRILDELDEKWNVHVPVLMHYDPNRTDISDRLREHYIPENRVNNETEIPSQADNATRPLDEIQEDESTSQNLTKIVTRANPADHLISLTRMLSDGLFFEPNHRVVKYHSKFVPTYAYYYTYVSDSLPAVYALIRAARPKRWYPWEVNIAGGVVLYYADKYIWRSKDPKRFGACHGDDILQLWSFSLITDIRPSSGDYPFSRDFVHSVVSFAKRYEY